MSFLGRMKMKSSEIDFMITSILSPIKYPNDGYTNIELTNLGFNVESVFDRGRPRERDYPTITN
jgi:hypothetical protein